MAATWVKCKGAIFVLSAGLAFTACSSAPDGNAKNTAATVKEKPYEIVTIEIKDMKFVPDSVTVKKGDEVIFVNRDMVTHCVTEEKTKAWTSAAIPAGEAYMLVAKESSDYYCAIHTVMKGKIVVK